MDLYEYETRNGGEWGSVRRTADGYVIERHSRYQGTRTGERHLVPADLVPWVGADLSEQDEHGESDGGRLIVWLDRALETGGTNVTDRIRVLDVGVVVQ